MEKLNKFTSPQAAFELRLNHALGTLRNVERTSIVLDVCSAGPLHVHDQFQHCLKLYRILSEVKPEIESVIKTGRKVCEEKTTRNPHKLNQRIDTLKHLYNNLGENVTQSKVILENLIKINKNIDENYEAVTKWLDEKSKESFNGDAKSRSEVELAMNNCFDSYDEYKRICDPIYLEDIRNKIEDLNKKLREVIDMDIMKSLNEMKTTIQNMDTVSIETLR